ncbi:MAG TPA: hypothetical protein VIW23_08305 [Candidatus Acidoferrum sp.]
MSVLSRPVVDKFASSAYFETHFIDAIERLSNVALCWESAIGWLKRVLGLQDRTEPPQIIDVTPSKRKVEVIERKKNDHERAAS